MNTTYDAPSDLGRLGQRALIIGGLALVLTLAGAALTGNMAAFFRSYLVGYVFCVGVALGSLALLMLQFLSGGDWGVVIRRVLEAATRTLPLLAILFIPVVLGMTSLYEWTHIDQIPSEEARKLVAHKQPYLNIPFFIGRTIFYFAVWIFLTRLLNGWSRRQDETGDPELLRKMQDWSGPGLVLYGLTVTFAAIDWVMSLAPEWFSTIFGLMLMAGQGVAAMAFVIIMAVVLGRREPMSHVFQPRHFQDLGKLLLALVMVWAYFNFSQFLIIWSGNLPEEIPWYIARFRGGWGYIGVMLVLFHFALPFVMLLSRNLKRDGRKLVYVALLVLFMRVTDLIWMIAPEFARHGHHTAVGAALYLLAPVGLGGVWLWWFMRQLQARPLMPVRDPHFEEAIEPEHHGAVAAEHH